jgi:hypothetical protein
MLIGAASFGGGGNTGGQWIDVRPDFDASIEQWRLALSMAYAGKGIGPDGVGAALAERYLFDSEFPEWVIKSVSEFASSIAQISDKITVETILKGIEFAVNNVPDGGLDIPGNYGSWRALTFASLYQPLQYPIDFEVFGGDSDASDDFEIHTIKPVVFNTPQPTIKTGQAVAPGGIKNNDANIESIRPYLEPVTTNRSPVSIVAIAAVLASFLI